MAKRRPERRRPRAPSPACEILVGIHPVLEALRARRRRLRRLRIRAGGHRPELTAALEAARAAGVPVEEVSEGEFAPAAGPDRSAQGIALEAGPLPEVDLPGLADDAGPGATLVALDGVEDPQNLGAIARVAEAAGVAGLILTRRRAPPLSPAVARASAGAIEWLPTARVANLGRALEQLKRGGYWVFGCDPEGREDLFALPDLALGGPRVVVLGAEGRGLRPGIQRVIDYRVRIPTAGRVASLNVASAAAVVLFELRRRSGAGGG